MSGLNGVLDDARRLVKAIKRLPSWMGEAAPEPVHDITSIGQSLETSLQKLQAETYPDPADLADVPRWLGQHPAPIGRRRRWWGRVALRSGVACDGHGCLVVEDALQQLPFVEEYWAGEPCGFPKDGWEPPAAEKLLEKLRPSTVGLSVAVEEARLAEAIETARFLRCGAAVLDAALVRTWVLSASCFTSSAGVTVEVERPHDPIGAVLFRGPGWWSVVMPMRVDEDDDMSGLVDVSTLVETGDPR